MFEEIRLDPKRSPLFSDRPRSAEVSAKAKLNMERGERAAARMMAAHLSQRMLYLALSRMLLKLADDQGIGALDPQLAHGRLLMGADQTAVADAEIERRRRGRKSVARRRRAAPIVVSRATSGEEVPS